ncbi:MAG: HAD-IC family P-type ATPase, partial [candidate division KSB1 bacterium]|nr:HAD-IC family P-type ATPase [candidate division KSB1 bacterium]
MTTKFSSFWSTPISDLMEALAANQQGLTSDEAKQRLSIYGFNRLKPKRKTDMPTLLLAQFKSPIILILIFAAILSFFLHDQTDALIILTIVLLSGLLGFWQERGAANAVEKLLALVQTKSVVLRDNVQQEISTEMVVPGDIVMLSAGAIVPGDCAILESKDLFVDEAALTGETFPVEKNVAVLPSETPLAKRTNTLFMGTHVVSGSAKAVVVHTGLNTEFGTISSELKLRPPETDFERGVRRFGYLLMEVTLMLVILIFAFNVYFHRPIVDAFLFSLALAVGLTPQLLPAIISINLSHGAKRMAAQQAIVKRLASIENFGSMNVLCSDKTGTLTQGKVQVKSAVDVEGQSNEKVLLFAYLNASFESGFINPLDEAIRNHQSFDISPYRKLDEIPYDFNRKRLSILVAKDASNLMITKGALQNILSTCTRVETSAGEIVDIQSFKERIQQQYENFSASGLRTLGVAYKHIASSPTIHKDDEHDMIFLGFLTLFDPPKAGIQEAIADMKKLGIELKMITGDNKLVAKSISQQVGIAHPNILTGSELRQMSDAALIHRVLKANIFAEVEPNQKERIILALKKAGKVVGYMGDGINDAPALYAADVGISVDGAVDVAKE